MAKKNLDPLSGPQTLVRHVLMRNTADRNAFYEMELRADAQGKHALYLRYGPMSAVQTEGGGTRSVIARGSQIECSIVMDEKMTEKRDRNYAAAPASKVQRSMYDGVVFSTPGQVRTEQGKQVALQRAQELQASMNTPEMQATLAAINEDVLFG